MRIFDDFFFQNKFSFYCSMSPERPPSIDGGPILESPNVVLSSVPIESGHIILQQQNGNHVIANGNYGSYTTISTSPPSSTIVHQQPSPSSAASSTPSSKLLVLQPNQLNENYVTSKSLEYQFTARFLPFVACRKCLLFDLLL